MIGEADAADVLLDAVGLSRSDVPPRALGADWFREQPNWMAASLAADSLVHSPELAPAPALMAAAALLEDDEADPVVQELVTVGFVEAMICSASHDDGTAAARIIDVCPVTIWRIWHQRRERLEALSEQRLGRAFPPAGLQRADAHAQMLSRCTTYRAESGRYVVLSELISSDRPSPWPLRHPVLTGLLFAAVIMLAMIPMLVRTYAG